MADCRSGPALFQNETVKDFDLPVDYSDGAIGDFFTTAFREGVKHATG